jgi:hypothetical protein
MFTKIKEITAFGFDVKSEINKKKATIKFDTKLKEIDAFYLNITLNKHTKVRSWIEERTLNDKKTNVILSVFPADLIKKQLKKLNPKKTGFIFFKINIK